LNTITARKRVKIVRDLEETVDLSNEKSSKAANTKININLLSINSRT
jgi:hypothetical protein